MAHDLSHDALGSAPMSMCLSNPNTDAIAQAVNSIGMDPGGLPLETDATGIDSTHPDTYSLEAQQDHDGLEGDVEDDDGCGVASDVPQGLTAVSIPDTMSLQSLLATMQGSGTGQLVNNGNGQIIQIVTLSNPGDLAALTGNNVGAKLVQLVPTTDQQLVSQVDGSLSSGVKSLMSGQAASSDLVTVPSLLSVPQPPPVQSLPPGCPTWAARLRDCEQIGDSYRGWVESEVELDLLLTYHKQQTQSLWGTRQSPSPGKPSTRLMWKSQYVPFDGVPFVNAGSRAIVMECQYGPRRKGGQLKRHQEVLGPRAAEYKQTCPARIYIKKVKKFPEYRVDVTQDKKSLKAAMEKAFMELKQRGTEYPGEERYFVQLPTEKAHEFHIEKPAEELETTPHRLHPKVANKIRDVVSTGETRLYVIRKALRRFVERELFDGPDDIPERHNLAYFPTVHDLQNHIYQAIKDIETGILPLKPHLVNVVAQPDLSNDIQEVDASALWATANEGPHAETVTVTLTQNSSEEGSHVISKVETHLSDGTTQISSTLNQETAQLLQKLHPQMFPVGTLIQLQNPNSASTIDLSGAQAHLVSVPASGDQAVVTMATEGQSSSIISTGTLDVSNVGTHNLISQTSDSAALSRLITQAEAITPLMKLEPSTADCMADSTDLSSAADRLGAEADSSMDTSTGSVGNLVPGTNGHLSAGVEPGEITDMHIPNIDGTSVTGLPVDGTQLVHADTQMAISGDNNMVTLAMSETGDLVKLVNEQAPTEGTEDDTQHMQ